MSRAVILSHCICIKRAATEITAAARKPEPFGSGPGRLLNGLRVNRRSKHSLGRHRAFAVPALWQRPCLFLFNRFVDFDILIGGRCPICLLALGLLDFGGSFVFCLFNHGPAILSQSLGRTKGYGQDRAIDFLVHHRCSIAVSCCFKPTIPQVCVIWITGSSAGAIFWSAFQKYFADPSMKIRHCGLCAAIRLAGI